MSWIDIASSRVGTLTLQERTLVEFLEQHDDLRPNVRGKDVDWVSRPGLDNALEKVLSKFRGAYKKVPAPALAKTVADPAVREILAAFYAYDLELLDDVVRGHRDAMVAENLVGELVERYLYETALQQLGWVWCAGSVVRAVDFIKRNPDGSWTALQVKNRDNSENSSSSRVRIGTTIEKWYRTRSRDGEEMWHLFPDPQARELLIANNGRQGFLDFIHLVASRLAVAASTAVWAPARVQVRTLA